MHPTDIAGQPIAIGDTVKSGIHTYTVTGFGTITVYGRGGERQEISVTLEGTGDLVETPAFAVRKISKER